MGFFSSSLPSTPLFVPITPRFSFSLPFFHPPPSLPPTCAEEQISSPGIDFLFSFPPPHALFFLRTVSWDLVRDEFTNTGSKLPQRGLYFLSFVRETLLCIPLALDSQQARGVPRTADTDRASVDIGYTPKKTACYEYKVCVYLQPGFWEPSQKGGK